MDRESKSLSDRRIMEGAIKRANISSSDGEFDYKYDKTTTAWAPWSVLAFETAPAEFMVVYSCWLTYGGFLKQE